MTEVHAAAGHVGFPCLMKPVGGSGSIQVRQGGLDELRASYAPLVAPHNYMGGQSEDGRIVEEYESGPEVSVEGQVAGGHVTTVAITSRFLGPEPHFVEIGHLMPADLPSAEAVEWYLKRVIAAVGTTMGAFHREIRLPGGEPVLVEPGVPASGDRVVELVKHTTGIPLPYVVAAAHVGRTGQP